MMTLIIGGSGSGKSAYAESLLAACTEEKYYIATMQVYDEEGEKRVLKHRAMREGKGFRTLELPVDVGEAVFPKKAAALLECMSNLVANEMFLPEGNSLGETVVEKVLTQIQQLSVKVNHLIIVTNNVFEDGICYDASTMEYLQTLGAVNCRLAEMADRVVEVVVGIPLVMKGEKEG